MASDPLEMLENNADLTKIYDFDLIDFQKKKEFVEAVFLDSEIISSEL